MKYRILSVLLAVCLILSVFSTSAFANDNTVTCCTVYLDTLAETDGDGSEAAPFNTLASAIAAIEASQDDVGTITVAGTVAVDANIPAHSKEITFTGGLFHYTNNIALGGPTVFENIALSAGVAGKTWIFLDTAGHPLTCGEGVTRDPSSYSLNIDAGADVSGKEIDLTLLSGTFGSVYVGSYSANDITVGRTDINISGTATLTNLILGANATGGSVTFTDDVFITIGGEVSDMYYTTKGDQPVFNGALTIIYNNGKYRVYEISETLTAEEGVYIMSCEKKDGSYLEATGTPGSFKVQGDNEAVALSTAGYISESVSKELAIANYGKYAVTFPDSDIEYLNGGSELRIKKDTTLDFAQVAYNDLDGKLFVGWNDKDGNAVSSGEFKAGDVLYAEYVDFSENDFCIKGTEVRPVSDNADKQGLRIIFEKSLAFEKAFKDAVGNVSFGAIYMPTDYSGGTDMETESSHITDRTTAAYSPKKVPAVNTYARSSTAEQYTLCITDSIEQLTKDKYYKFYTVKGYAEYTDKNGVARVLYTDYLTTSLYKTALYEKENDPEGYNTLCDTIINYVEGQRITDLTTGSGSQAFSRWLTGPLSPESQTDRDENHASYLLNNGLLVRDIVIGDSSAGGTPIEIAAFSDIHFNNYNKMDALLNNPSVNAQWYGVDVVSNGVTSTVSRDMGRTDKGFGSVANSAKLMEFGSFYDKTVVIGDIMDYFSYGSAELAKKLIIDRSINNNALIALGNHETAELFAKVTAASGFREMFTQNYKYMKLGQQFWPNDIYYHSEVITKGDKKVKVVVMDNQAVKYQDNSNIYNRLSADIADSKTSGVPILIFQHVPMNTYNEAYPKFVPFNTGYGAAMPDSEAGAMGENNYYIKRGSDAKGPSESYTAKVFDLIASNPDVIKGIFCGHVHNNFYSEILATTYDADAKKYVTMYADDGVTPLTIPQYIVGGSYMGGVAGASVLKISVY